MHLQHWNHSKIPINWDAGYSSNLQKKTNKKETSSKTHWQSKATDNKKRELKKEKEKKKTLVKITAANPYKFILYDEWAGPNLENVSHRCLRAELMTD